MESTSEMETALQFYEAARDNLSLVRVYCYCGNLEKVSVTYSACRHQSLKTCVKAGSCALMSRLSRLSLRKQRDR